LSEIDKLRKREETLSEAIDQKEQRLQSLLNIEEEYKQEKIKFKDTQMRLIKLSEEKECLESYKNELEITVEALNAQDELTREDFKKTLLKTEWLAVENEALKIRNTTLSDEKEVSQIFI